MNPRLQSISDSESLGKLRVGEFFFEVPLDYSRASNGDAMRLFARSVRRPATSFDRGESAKEQPPWLLYLQGGPGYGCGAPQHFTWLPFVLDKGYQVIASYPQLLIDEALCL